MTTYTTPLTKTFYGTTPEATTASGAYDQVLVVAPWAGVITSVTYVPETAVTGAATNYRTCSVLNKGLAGAGSTIVATLAFDSSDVTADAFDEIEVPLSGTAARLVVAAGDVLAWDESVTGEGAVGPAGLVRIVLSRT